MKVDICVSRDPNNPTEWMAELGPVSEDMRKKHGNPLYIGGPGMTSVEAAADAIEWAWKQGHTVTAVTRYAAWPKPSESS